MANPSAGMGILGGLFFFVIWLAMMVAMVGGYVIALIALWRGMKAQESMAQTLKQIAQK